MSPGPNPDYRARFDALGPVLPGSGIDWLASLRQTALAHFDTYGLPSPRDEDWKYTNVSAIEKKRFKPRIVTAPTAIDPPDLNRHRLGEAWTLVFVDGHFASELSDLSGLPDGVCVAPLSAALTQPVARLEADLGRIVAKSSQHGFISFNTAFFSDGVFLHVPPDAVLTKPVQIINVAAHPDAATSVRNLLVLEAGARAQFVETYVTSGDGNTMAVAITEAVLGERATLECHTLHSPSERAVRFGGIYADVGPAASFKHTNLSLGGLLVRNEIHADLAAGADCSLDGLFVGQGRRHVDNHTLIRHHDANGTSREDYRGVLSDRARGVFQGRIVVQPKAQKTDAQMNNRNLLLSEDAEMDTKPQLEIHADDVKCAHGVAVGQLDPESIFYLESRGVDPVAARNMLTFAFANAMVDAIPLSGFRDLAQDALLSLFPHAGIRKDWL